MKFLIAAILFAAVFPIVAQTAPTIRSTQFSCRFVGCRSFKQLAKTKDSDVKSADMVCFYDGENPASKDKDEPTTDEFFLLMDGRKSAMLNGAHPGVFVNIVKDGLPGGYAGFGPEHGGLENSDMVRSDLAQDAKSGIAKTYDDLGDSERFAYFFFGQQTIWTGKDFKLTDASLMRRYEETVIRKSTGRFVQRRVDFDSRVAEGSAMLEPGPFTVRYKGQCFAATAIR